MSVAGPAPEALCETLCDGYPGPVGAPMVSALSRLLAARQTMAGSRLTGDGFPVELTFATASDELRWTADPWEPGMNRPPLAAARQALTRLTALPPLIDDLQAHGLGQVFAWIGARHDKAGNTPERYKLYLDLPDARAEAAVRALWGLPAPRLNRPVTPRMAAVDLADGSGEIYYRTEAQPHELPRLLAPAGQPAAALLARIEAEWGHRLRDRLPGGSIGISYAHAPEPQGCLRATVYLFARSLWGTDARIRNRWLALNRAPTATRASYAHASRGLASRRSWASYHGMVGFHLADDLMRISLGVRPVVAA